MAPVTSPRFVVALPCSLAGPGSMTKALLLALLYLPLLFPLVVSSSRSARRGMRYSILGFVLLELLIASILVLTYRPGTVSL